MANEYNNIEITADEHQALENLNEITESPTDDNVSEQEATTEETSQVEVTEPIAVDNFEIDGKDFSRDQILQWRDDSANKTNWQKSNTEKAQELSKWNKLTEKVQKDESFRNHLKDFYYDDPESAKALGLDGEITPLEETKTSSVVEMRLEALESVEGARLMEHRVDQLDSVLTKLEGDNPDYLGDQDKVSEFLEFADSNSQKFLENGMPNLGRAFKEWSHGQMQEELAHLKKLDKNSKRNTGIINTSEAGAKEIKSDKKLSDWKDVDMNNPDIAKYFDN